MVHQVHIHDLFVSETEHDPPVAGDANTPLARAVAIQRMQPKLGRISAAWVGRLLEPEQDAPEPRGSEAAESPAFPRSGRDGERQSPCDQSGRSRNSRKTASSR